MHHKYCYMLNIVQTSWLHDTKSKITKIKTLPVNPKLIIFAMHDLCWKTSCSQETVNVLMTGFLGMKYKS